MLSRMDLVSLLGRLRYDEQSDWISSDKKWKIESHPRFDFSSAESGCRCFSAALMDLICSLLATIILSGRPTGQVGFS